MDTPSTEKSQGILPTLTKGLRPIVGYELLFKLAAAVLFSPWIAWLLATLVQSSGSGTVTLLRWVIGVGCALFLLGHVGVVFVAIAVSGSELLREWPSYVAMIVPILYAVYCLVQVRVPGRLTNPLKTAVVAGCFTLPALFFSYLGLGYLLPVFGGLMILGAWLDARQGSSNLEPTLGEGFRGDQI